MLPVMIAVVLLTAAQRCFCMCKSRRRHSCNGILPWKILAGFWRCDGSLRLGAQAKKRGWGEYDRVRPQCFFVWGCARRLMHVCIEHHGLGDRDYEQVRPQCLLWGCARRRTAWVHSDACCTGASSVLQRTSPAVFSHLVDWNSEVLNRGARVSAWMPAVQGAHHG